MALRRFVIERDIPKVGTFEREQLRELPPSRMRCCTSSAPTSGGSRATSLTTRPSVCISPGTRPSSASMLRSAAFQRQRSLK